jgi:hypothetical protein
MGAMGCARPNPNSSPAASALWHRRLCIIRSVLALGTAYTAPVEAQVPAGASQNSPSPASEAGQPSPSSLTTPVLPGSAPETLPPPPITGFGFANPTSPPYSVNNEAPTQLSPSTLRLLSPHAAVVPLQQYDPTAPAVLIQPRATLSEVFTDNVNYVHAPRDFAAITQLGAGASVSVDTPRLQAVATGQANGNLYLPGSNSSLNQVYGSLYGNAHATLYPDLLYLDAQSLISPSSTLPGLGFQNLSTLPRNQQTQQFVNNLSPYVVKSFDGLVDTELRYTFGYSNYGGNTAAVGTPGVSGVTNLASTTLNEGTFIAATGQDLQRFLARFTADAAELDSSSVAQSSQVSAFNDFEYRFLPRIAARGRVGFQNQRYPFSPAATFAGATWLAGGRLGTAGPDQPAYVSLEYGKQQGVYGFTGAAQFNITPSMLFTARLVQGISSQGQLFSTSLANSTLSPSGGIVDQYTGLPTAFYYPGIGLSNNVYRQHLLNAGLSDALPPNYYSLYAFYTEQQSLTPPVASPTKSLGLSFVYTRDIRPDLNGFGSLGFVNSVNSPTVLPGTSTLNFSNTTNFNTATATLGVNYVLSRTLTGSIVYTFSYQTTGTVLVGGRNGDVFANQLQFQLTKTF